MSIKFKWRFESVKKAKDLLEEQSHQNLINALDILSTEDIKLAGLFDQQKAYTRQLREKQNGHLNTIDLARINTYLETLASKIKEQTQQVEKSQSRVNQYREALLKTVQEGKVLKNLKKRDFHAFRKIKRRQDQVTMDETANRKKRNGNSTT